MEDNQRKYLDKVVSILVKHTNINGGMIYFPFDIRFRDDLIFYLPFNNINQFNPISLPVVINRWVGNFFHHIHDVYGLTESEMETVYSEYMKIIKNKIENGR